MKVIITGSSGMVGKGVLIECLKHLEVEEVLVINRSSINMDHPKLKEVLCSNFLNISSIKNDLEGYDACFHCMGVSSVGISEENYYKLTYNVTEKLATSLNNMNPDMTFIYVSGQGTDSSEKGRSSWARVKGKTENMLFKIGFKNAIAFRPGAIIPGKGIKSKAAWINFMLLLFRPLYPLIKKMKSVTTSENIGLAMFNTVNNSLNNKIVNGKQINNLAKV